jgi:hypothetical protein
MKARRIQTQSTLLDLVSTVSRFANTDAEVVAAVAYLVNSGRVQLGGNLAGAKISYASPLDVFPAWARPRFASAPPHPRLAA